MKWCAVLTEYLTVDEAVKLIVLPLQEAEDKSDPSLMGDFLTSIVQYRFTQNDEPSDELIELWNVLATLVVARPDIKHYETHDWYPREIGLCISATIFTPYGLCLFDHPWPAANKVLPSIAQWVDAFSYHPSSFASLLTFLSHAGQVFLPEPGLQWLSDVFEKKKDDQGFWDYASNGDEAAKILKGIVDICSSDVAESKGYRAALTRMSDILIERGSRQAAQIQQELARLG
jgi:hypothetical protein